MNLSVSEGQLETQLDKSFPSSTPVQEAPSPLHLSEHTSTHVENADAGAVGHMPMHADRDPPGQSAAGEGAGGVGVGVAGDGTGTGTGTGTGAGAGGGLQSRGSGP